MLTSPTRVVVIDDEPLLLSMLEALLESAGFVVRCFSNVKDALDYFQTHEADVVLLDWELPDMDGVTACGAIRLLVDTRIIMLTVRCTEVDKVAGLNAGADDYVTKPFQPNELIARVHATARRMPNVYGASTDSQPLSATNE